MIDVELEHSSGNYVLDEGFVKHLPLRFMDDDLSFLGFEFPSLDFVAVFLGRELEDFIEVVGLHFN